MVLIQEREKNILAIFSILVALAIFWYVFKPSGDKYHLLKTNISKLQAELRNPSVTEQSLKEIIETVEDLSKQISILNKQLPPTEERDFLIKDLEELAKENKINIVSFLPKDAVPVTMSGKEINPRGTKLRRKRDELESLRGKVLKTTITIESSGKFNDYTKFFGDILTYYRAVEVSDIIITRAGVSTRMGEDKRFSRSRASKDPLEDAKNMDLNVNFTLLAYTSLQND
jgi:Tfp pilus assembly protein PilO